MGAVCGQVRAFPCSPALNSVPRRAGANLSSLPITEVLGFLELSPIPERVQDLDRKSNCARALRTDQYYTIAIV
jgi:hypothetical protein